MKRVFEQSFRRLAWLGSALICLGLFFKITWELSEDSHISILDRKILLFIGEHRRPHLTGPALDLTALGSPTLLSIATVTAVYVLLIRRDRVGAFYFAIGSIGAGLGTLLLKYVFERPRPSVIPRLVEVSGYSYPSGHSFAATAFFTLVLFFSWRHFHKLNERFVLSTITFCLIIAVCASRLYLGVHYPSDVISGALLGAAWSCFLTAAFAAFTRFNERINQRIN
jgi:undecaprenyl-diphosphatase